ncbi:MerR family transcriptional regulator [Bacillus paranthracis]|uniref:MerR family transcriptional regulator n=1 Tax=Bacillus paranthracis TaxID=2026186 RepID=UPI002151F042|nr:MerR family transcriptional regulator [Bacillus paranthracis]MCR6465152.1 MerR family transcriptional regulator [Bacillus paranthracis]MCR9021602.1 MerR family transcriptional regulator [Bacillus paranthracis]
MEEDVVVNIQFLKTSEVAEGTGLAVSTVNKYSRELEDNGYEFSKDGNTRLYTSEDVRVLRAIKNVREETNVSLSVAVAMVMEKIEHDRNIAKTEIEHIQHSVAATSADITTNDNPQTQLVAELMRSIVREEVQNAVRDEVQKSMNELTRLFENTVEELKAGQSEETKQILEKVLDQVNEGQQKMIESTEELGTRLEREKSTKKKWYKPWG